MTPPRPTALQLVTQTPGAVAPTVPFGLREWSPHATARAVLLEVRSEGRAHAVDLVAQIPPASELPGATLLFLLGEGVRQRRFLRWMGLPRVRIPRAARCTALLARGYVAIGAAVDGASGIDLAWGFSSPC